MNTHPIILDTDPGIDDALAMLLALASPEIDLRALTVVHGNSSLTDGVRNALDVLALAGAMHIPVAAGTNRPLIRPPLTATETHGSGGLGYAVPPPSPAQPAATHAVDVLIDTLLAAPGEISLVAIGPLTNLALALRKEPRIAHAARQVVLMGGALRSDGNTTPMAEFNMYVDPHAAHIVLHSGLPLTLLPWDITRDVLLTQEHVERLLHIPGALTSFVGDATRFYMDFHRDYLGFAGCSINDPAALALLLWPDLAQLQPVYVDIELSGALTLGKTVGDFMNVTGQAPNVQVVTSFDTDRFLALFLARMKNLAHKLNEASSPVDGEG